MNQTFAVRQDWTPRDFMYVTFQDAYDKTCSVQQSSVIGEYEDAGEPGTSALWVGIDGQDRMHLSREHVQGLIDVFQKWLETGEVAWDGNSTDDGSAT